MADASGRENTPSVITTAPASHTDPSELGGASKGGKGLHSMISYSRNLTSLQYFKIAADK